mmetsp:Transcript_28711/g.56136  ORF Transcript_28711/g.56136 Transcript_28711/m.56136 type:complete len:89 (-) Transcript_28711:2045-2311(-)
MVSKNIEAWAKVVASFVIPKVHPTKITIREACPEAHAMKNLADEGRCKEKCADAERWRHNLVCIVTTNWNLPRLKAFFGVKGGVVVQS